MSFLDLLLPKAKPVTKPYVDAGLSLTVKLIKNLNLDGWQDGLPVYTREESKAVDAGLAEARHVSDGIAGGSSTAFQREVVEPLQRMHVAMSLQNLACSGWDFSDKNYLPAGWKARVSTLLKAWASHLHPNALLDIGDLLNRAGYKTEARESYTAVLLFPTYAHIFFILNNQEAAELAKSYTQKAEEGLRNI